MKSTNVLEVWKTARLAPYAGALVRFEAIALTPTVPHAELAAARSAVYAACGSPFGTSPLAEWTWWEFGQWQTVN